MHNWRECNHTLDQTSIVLAVAPMQHDKGLVILLQYRLVWPLQDLHVFHAWQCVCMSACRHHTLPGPCKAPSLEAYINVGSHLSVKVKALQGLSKVCCLHADMYTRCHLGAEIQPEICVVQPIQECITTV